MKFTVIAITLIVTLLVDLHKCQVDVKPADALTAENLRRLPSRSVNQWLGHLADQEIPIWMRQYVFMIAVDIFRINMTDFQEQDLTKYKTFNEFFARPIKAETRKIAKTKCLVSPADCKVDSFGTVDRRGQIVIVKNISYSVEEFLGPATWKKETDLLHSSSEDPFIRSLKEKKENTQLYFVALFLNVEDYHRFHSPTNWTMQYRRHFAGEMLDFVPEYIPNLYPNNERVALFGKWKQGFFSMTPIGGFLVGSIHLYNDPDLVTDRMLDKPGERHEKKYRPAPKLTYGESVGQFNFGSCVYLIFEGPMNLQWTIKEDDKIKVGQEICTF